MRSTDPIENIFDLFMQIPAVSEQSRQTRSPRMNVLGGEEQLTLEFELPGFEQEEIELSLEERQLTVKAVKESESKDYLRQEIAGLAFERSVTVPENIDREGIKAETHSGILTVSLPRVPVEEKVFKIAVG